MDPLPRPRLRMGVPSEHDHRLHLSPGSSHGVCTLVPHKRYAEEGSGLSGMVADEKTHIWLDAAKRLKDQFDPELLERITKLNLQYSLGGGLVSQDLRVYFAVNMSSEESCRTHLKRFQVLVPVLSQALKRACPRPLLTKRETAILERRAMGELIKQIAVAEGISARTVREHLQSIKKKLYTDDLVNAVVIAVRCGMLDETWKELRWQSKGASHR
jgi:DNA-binding CsgD family transcriptional regulator